MFINRINEMTCCICENSIYNKECLENVNICFNCYTRMLI